MKKLSCWKIMNCENLTCIARYHPDKECWEIVGGLEDYRAEFNICSDCLVYVLKTGSLALSPNDMARLARRGRSSCPLAALQ